MKALRALTAALTVGATGTLILIAFAAPAASQTVPSLVVEASAVGGGGTFSFLVSCASPPAPLEGIATASTTLERPRIDVAAGTTGRIVLTPSDGATCTVLEENAGGGSLSSTAGGAPVRDVQGAPLGETVPIHAGSTATVSFTNNFVAVQDARVTRATQRKSRRAELPRTGTENAVLVVMAGAMVLAGAAMSGGAHRSRDVRRRASLRADASVIAGPVEAQHRNGVAGVNTRTVG